MPIYSANQQKIAEQIDNDNVTSSNWKDWRWQLKNSIQEIDTLESLLGITFEEKERKKLQLTVGKFPLSVTPYYLSLIDRDDYRDDPIYRQAVPVPAELQIEKCDMSDPLSEDKDSPVPGLTHRYPDRVLLQVSNVCSMYCRHCTRKRKVGDVDSIPDRKTIEAAIDYIRKTPVVRDVLLSGGDPLMLSDDYLDWILGWEGCE